MSVQKIADVSPFSLSLKLRTGAPTSTRSGLECDVFTTTKDARVAAVLRVIQEQPRLRPFQLAALVGLSKQWLRKLFKEEVGVSIGSYAMEARLQLACKLLATTDRSLKEICDEVGIPDPSNFSRYFKRNFDETPSEYRKRAHRERFYQEKGGFTKSKQLQPLQPIGSNASAGTD